MGIIINPKITMYGIEFDLKCKVCGTADHVVAYQEVDGKWNIWCPQCKNDCDVSSLHIHQVAIAWLEHNMSTEEFYDFYTNLLQKEKIYQQQFMEVMRNG